ncbi:MAG: c-type cytochrome [Phototrophicaceae bacterium]
MLRIVKWLLGIIGALLLLVVALITGVVMLSTQRMNHRYELPSVVALNIPTDEATLAEGERLYISRGCVDCHLENGSGRNIIDDPALGTLTAANLTHGEGGLSSDYSVEDYMRALQHGVGKDGMGLLLMPSYEYAQMREEEMAALIAYLQSFEPVRQIHPDSTLGPIGRTLLVTNQAKFISAEHIDHATIAPSTVAVGATVEYGEYLAVMCVGCHGEGYSGGEMLGAPDGSAMPTNITFHESGLAGWSLDDFTLAVQSGTRPDGTSLDPFMPYGAYASLNATEVEALYLYLQTVTPQAEGNH